MKILAVNAGSSSLKFQMYEMPEEKVLISGVFERIGIDNSFYTIKLNGEKIRKEVELANHFFRTHTKAVFVCFFVDRVHNVDFHCESPFRTRVRFI